MVVVVASHGGARLGVVKGNGAKEKETTMTAYRDGRKMRQNTAACKSCCRTMRLCATRETFSMSRQWRSSAMRVPCQSQAILWKGFNASNVTKNSSRNHHSLTASCVRTTDIIDQVTISNTPVDTTDDAKGDDASNTKETKEKSASEASSGGDRKKKQKAPVSISDIIRWSIVKMRTFVKPPRHSHLPQFEGDTLISCSAQFPPFVFVHNGDSFLDTLDRLVQDGKLSSKVREGLVELFVNYRGALMKNKKEVDADGEASKMIASIAERVALQFLSPYTFPSRHERILEPFNYYLFGQRYCGNLINFDCSYVGNVEGFVKIQNQLNNGDNVVIMANHQSEADPGVWAWMTQYVSPSLATDVYYVAGDRVVLDTFAKPFSMGRNLICVHSKRHMDDDIELRAAKMKTNQKSVRELGNMMKKGGALIWVAPSGGRDRIDIELGSYKPSLFDPSAIQLLKRLLEKNNSAHPGHIYPMAMVSAEIMPPPRGVEKTLGEERILNHHGVGISLGEEIFEESIQKVDYDWRDPADIYCDHVYQEVSKLYKPLADAVYGNQDRDKAQLKSLSQPWRQLQS